MNSQAVYRFDNNLLHCAGLRGSLLNSDTMTNTFDAANRLIETERAGTTLEPIYNGVNDRVGQTTSVTTTYFALDVMGLPEVIYTTEGNLYLHLPGVIMAESGTGDVRYLLSDGLGSVRQATDESGEVVAYNEFDPYGNPVQNDSSPYGFTGEWWERDVGLLHLRARWYAPETGTFLSRDPVESEPPYQYVRGHVVNLVDPSGLFPPEVLERSMESRTLHKIKTQRRGLYQLLLDANDTNLVEALDVSLPNLSYEVSNIYPVKVSTIYCDDGILGFDLKPWSMRFDHSYERYSVDTWFRSLETTASPSKVWRGHYYSLLDKDNLLYNKLGDSYGPNDKVRTFYSDFEGQDSPLPDVVAVGYSLDAVIGLGGTKLFDKFGSLYISMVGSFGVSPPANFLVLDGYIHPASLGNEQQKLEDFLTGFGHGYEADAGHLGGKGTSRSPAFPGAELTWSLRQNPVNPTSVNPTSVGFGWNAAYTFNPHRGTIKDWDFLDKDVEDVPASIVASLPDNGCNCGQ